MEYLVGLVFCVVIVVFVRLVGLGIRAYDLLASRLPRSSNSEIEADPEEDVIFTFCCVCMAIGDWMKPAVEWIGARLVGVVERWNRTSPK